MKKEFVVEWFVNKGILSSSELENDLSINYFEAGLIDSFGFLELISACEEKFGITFRDNDFSDDSIFTIEGLIRTIERL